MSTKSKISSRIYIVYGAVLVFAVLVMVSMMSIQFSFDNEAASSEDGFDAVNIELVNIKASRGNIYADDVEKSALAISVPVYEIRMDLMTVSDKLFEERVDSLSWYLSDLFKDRTKGQYKEGFKQARKNKKRYYLVKKRVSYGDLKQVKGFPIYKRGKYKGGLIVLKQNKRAKPFSLLAKRTIGYLSETDTVVGLEGAYNHLLKGVDGSQYMKRVAGGIYIPLTDEYLVEPQDGHDVFTTIDVNIQDVAEKALLRQLKEQNAKHGSVVLMEVKTGKIRAIANLSKRKNGNYDEVYNHIIGRATEPGSTFKLFSLLVALEDGKVSVNDLVDTRDGTRKYYDQVMKDAHDGGDGLISVKRAFELSSNVGISSVVFDAYRKNPKQFMDGLQKIGLGQKSGVEIMGEGSPYIKNVNDPTWSGVSLPWISIGYETKLTPLQILTVYNAVANDGEMVKPQFVNQIKLDNKLIKDFEPIVLNKKICSEKTIKSLKVVLEGVVENGTARNLKGGNFKIAGKTGTARIAKGDNGYGKDADVKHQASFCGYFPADNPKYSCIVVVAAPSKSIYGNVVSGSVFKEIADKVYANDIELTKYRETQKLQAEYMPVSKNGYAKDVGDVFESLKIPVSGNVDHGSVVKTFSQKEKVQLKKHREVNQDIPNVKGMGLRDAVYFLENKGFSVKVKGSGAVLSQNLVSEKVIEIVLG